MSSAVTGTGRRIMSPEPAAASFADTAPESVLYSTCARSSETSSAVIVENDEPAMHMPVPASTSAIVNMYFPKSLICGKFMNSCKFGCLYIHNLRRAGIVFIPAHKMF